MLTYVTDALTRLRHNQPCNPKHQPYLHIKPNYCAKAQYVEAADVSPPLSVSNKKFVQEVTETFLYYALAVNPIILTALGSITSHQANQTEHTMKKVKQFLDYAPIHPDAILTYHGSDMVLAGHSNASYLSETKPRRRTEGNLFMSNST